MPKTFKDLTPKEAKKYWEALLKREKRKKETIKERFYDAWELVRKISKVLYEKY